MIDFTDWYEGVNGQVEAIEEDYSVIESMGIENIDFINEEYFADNNGVVYWNNHKSPSKMTTMLKELQDAVQQTLSARRKLNLLNDFKEIGEQMYWEDEVYEWESIDLDA